MDRNVYRTFLGLRVITPFPPTPPPFGRPVLWIQKLYLNQNTNIKIILTLLLNSILCPVHNKQIGAKNGS